MAHELTVRADGAVEMGYVTGTFRWHGLGNEIEPGADVDTWVARSGMGWEIKRSRVRYGEPPAQRIDEDHHVLFRGDTKDPLSIVSPSYKVVQPRQVLEFFRDLTEQHGFTLTTAGTLFGGRRFWALAAIGESAVVIGRDQVDGYLLLSSSCDGSLATTAQLTTVCVVCNNTLSAAIGRAKGAVRVSHRSTFDPGYAKDELGVVRGSFKSFMTDARRLSEVAVTPDQAAAFTGRLLTGAPEPTKELQASKQYQKILALFNGEATGGDLPGRAGTAWGLVNAVTDYVDHHAPARTGSHQLASAWFGRGDALKTGALTLARELAGLDVN